MRKKFFIYGFLLFLIVAAIYYYTERGFLLVIILPLLLIVGVGIDMSGGASVTGVTFNSVAMTKIIEKSDTPRNVTLWGLIAPSTGTHSIAVSLSSGVNCEAYGISFYNADQVTGWGATQIASGASTPITLNLTPTANNSYIVDSALTTFDTMTVGGSQTQIQNVAQNGWQYGGSRITSLVATPTSTTMSWTTQTHAWAQCAVEILQIAVSASPSVSPSVSPSASPSASVSPSISPSGAATNIFGQSSFNNSN